MTPEQLKTSILQMAIQGKIVEQRKEEGTADKLINYIKSVKEKKIESGKLKAEKSLPSIKEDEIPFDIPDTWKWVRLGDYCEKVTDQVASGSFAALRDNVPSLKEPDYAIMVKTADFANGFSTNLTYTTEHGYRFLENSNLFGGELILSNIGSIGKCFIVPDLGKKMTLAPNAIMLRLVDDTYRDYLYYFILSAQGYKELMEISSGTTMKKYNKTDLKKILIPVPPLEEQQRIVSKLEELLPYVDRYAEAYEKLEQIKTIFPEDMKKSILQSAIQGKLVEQRLDEGTADKLFEEIQEEKKRLINEKKIKKEKPLSEIEKDEIPFDIPDTWKFVRLGTVVSLLSGADFPPNKYNSKGEGVPYMTGASNIENNQLIVNRWTPEPNNISNEGDLLLVCKGSGYGKTAMNRIGEVHIARQFMAFQKGLSLNFDYLNYYLQAEILQIKKNGQGVIPGIDRKSVLNMIFPMPPLKEQERIVKKIEELLPYCDRLCK